MNKTILIISPKKTSKDLTCFTTAVKGLQLKGFKYRSMVGRKAPDRSALSKMYGVMPVGNWSRCHECMELVSIAILNNLKFISKI